MKPDLPLVVLLFCLAAMPALSQDSTRHWTLSVGPHFARPIEKTRELQTFNEDEAFLVNTRGYGATVRLTNGMEVLKQKIRPFAQVSYIRFIKDELYFKHDPGGVFEGTARNDIIPAKLGVSYYLKLGSKFGATIGGKGGFSYQSQLVQAEGQRTAIRQVTPLYGLSLMIHTPALFGRRRSLGGVDSWPIFNIEVDRLADRGYITGELVIPIKSW